MKVVLFKTMAAMVSMLLFLAMSFTVKDAMYSQLLTSVSFVTGVFALHCMSTTQKSK
jgi:hypothetical protein